MAKAPLGLVTDYLHRMAAPLAASTDADLLGLYAIRRDEDAFTTLLGRHGPMVLGVCRRALGATPDADDAFQATFVALAQQAGRISDSVPGWLYRVAVRTSRRALRRTQRPARDVEAVDPTDCLAAVEWREVRRLLDDELNRLPGRWRTPLVLCYLEGLTRDEAARQLGWSLRTLHRRLDEGRTRLRARLSRRGLGPAVLATAVLSAPELQADVAPALARETARLVARGGIVPAAIRLLVPRVSTTGGLAMKALLSSLVLVAGLTVVLTVRQPTEAGPLVPPAATPNLVGAPTAKDAPADDAITKKVREAQKNAIAYLKGRQKDQGAGQWNWENDTLANLQPGGTSALALLALLESGVKADDEVVARGLKYLTTVEPKHTYVVSLQTQVFCKANQKEDADRIKRNVKWLEDSAIWMAGKFEGWSYSPGGGGRTDNSNTRYGISALYAAHKAGFKVAKEGFWQAVQDYYTRTQTKAGGWTYANENPAGKGTHTMTVSGLLGLTQAKDVLGKDDNEANKAIDMGFAWVAGEFRLANEPHTFYNYDVIAALGRASERKDFGTKDKKIEWYLLGTDWLVRNQKPDGSWQIPNALDQYPVISTSFALRFLASRPD